VTVELDLADAEAAKSRYPRYVAELDPAAGGRARRYP
jgi:hypothetical protein